MYKMNRRKISFRLGLLASIIATAFNLHPPAFAQSTMPNVDPRNVASLDGEWRFCLVSKAKDAEELARIFIEPGFESPAFKTIPVPANWAMHGWEDPTWVNG